jgi:hydroxymethylpyrimidine pyrophosphatase-like HAD family hydrolase
VSATPAFTREHVAGLRLGPDLLVGLDIDGTILGLDDSLSRRVQRSISRVVASGARLVLATGRSLIAVLPVIERLGLEKGFAVCSNGAVTIAFDERGHEMVDVITFDPGPALRLLREHAPDVIFAVEDLGRGFKVTRPFPEGELGGVQEVVEFEELVAAPATRVTLRAPEWTSQEFHDLVSKSGLHGVSYAVGWSAWLDMTPDGVSKASALEAVRQRYEVPEGSTLVVGDGQNDIEMFGWAGVAVAMDGADETTKAAADAVTGPVELDGLVSVLDAIPAP